MKKLGKSRKGFTLVEMMLAIAIIVILASALVLGIGQYLNKAKAAAPQMQREINIALLFSVLTTLNS